MKAEEQLCESGGAHASLVLRPSQKRFFKGEPGDEAKYMLKEPLRA